MRLSLPRISACLVAGVACGVVSAATITGTITYEGKVPTLKPIDMSADASCAKMHGGTPQPSDLLAAPGKWGTSWSRAGGLAAGKTFPAPTTPVVMDQKGFTTTRTLRPHGRQPFKVLNSDGTAQ
jgi:hypothetical protein